MTELALTAVIAFIVGYQLARIEFLVLRGRSEQASAPQGFSVKNSGPTAAPRAAISIDERKVVSQIETSSLQKVSDIQLGNQTVAEDDIAASVSKLAQLKRR